MTRSKPTLAASCANCTPAIAPTLSRLPIDGESFVSARCFPGTMKTVTTPTANDPFAFTGLTFDDVLLLPNKSDVIPSEAHTSAQFSRRIRLAIPLSSSAMDTVTEARMAIAMARVGGIGVIHRNLSIEDQAQQVSIVKRSEAGMITDPVTIGPDDTLAELDEQCGRYRVSGLPVVDEVGLTLSIIP